MSFWLSKVRVGGDVSVDRPRAPALLVSPQDQEAGGQGPLAGGASRFGPLACRLSLCGQFSGEPSRGTLSSPARRPVSPRLSPICLSHTRLTVPPVNVSLGPASSAGQLHGAWPGRGPGLSPARLGCDLRPQPFRELAEGGACLPSCSPPRPVWCPGLAAPCQRGGINAGARLEGREAGVARCWGEILRFRIKGQNSWETQSAKCERRSHRPGQSSLLLSPPTFKGPGQHQA